MRVSYKQSYQMRIVQIKPSLQPPHPCQPRWQLQLGGLGWVLWPCCPVTLVAQPSPKQSQSHAPGTCGGPHSLHCLPSSTLVVLSLNPCHGAHQGAFDLSSKGSPFSQLQGPTPPCGSSLNPYQRKHHFLGFCQLAEISLNIHP